MKQYLSIALVAFLFPLTANTAHAGKLTVTTTAYNSVSKQTDGTPSIAAWGDRLRPGMKAVAVSRDLLKYHGFNRGTKVRIEGLLGQFVVLDKMHPRWRKKVDVYMGRDVGAAKRWGKRKVKIEFSH